MGAVPESARSLSTNLHVCFEEEGRRGAGVQGCGEGELDGCQNARVTVDRFNPDVSGAKLSISSILCGFAPFCEKVPVS